MYEGLYKSKGRSPKIDAKWTWISFIDRLANGDITKFDQIYELNYVSSLNLLSYYKERDESIEEFNKSNQKF